MSTIEVEHASRWYGNVVAVNDVTMDVGPGVTGLLGPNGAGKSTLLHMMSGFLEPSIGAVRVDRRPTWHDHDLYRTIGLVPERDAVYGYLTGWQLTLASARLHGLPDPEEAARRALATVELTDAQDRRIDTYSKGMRQRAKVAAALVHEPEVLLLDEPFNGMDPRQRLHMMDLVRTMGAEGRTVLFSSHILEEVERVAEHIQVIIAGRLAASGDFREIRRLMTDRPHVFTIRSSDDRRLATALIADRSTTGIEVGEDGLRVHAADFGRFTWLVPQVSRDLAVRVREVRPADESLESVFSYLVTP
ncbi:MAG TPA: ABC transporter ATP-binding protein [Terriglobales bacterium]|nr:ABC transporter ATP-binding protein [Terriglobales bacterium]